MKEQGSPDSQLPQAVAERSTKGNMTSWHSYPKVWNMGHSAILDLFADDVVCEEKVDGSQFSFGIFDFESGERGLRIRSKGAQMIVDAPEGMFIRAVETVKALQDRLHVGWTYRAEYLAKPHHNALRYDRVPKDHLMVFDINTAEEVYLSRPEKEAECERIGLEVIPLLHSGRVETLEFFRSFLDRNSVLGGQKIEGVVAKNYARFGKDKKVLMGKFVSEAFKEVHSKEWKNANPTCGDIIDQLSQSYRCDARWHKAVIHLREKGLIEDSPRDIGKLIPAIQEDLVEECAEEIKGKLWDFAKKHIVRKSVAGFPEWYKEQLLKKQFESHDEEVHP